MPITTLRTPTLAIQFSNLIADIIFAFLVRKILILTQNQELQKNFSLSSKSWWPVTNRTSTIYKFQKKVSNREVKLQSYIPSDKVCLSRKYLKTNQNQKLKAKFLNLFQVLQLVDKQTYKLKLPKKLKTHNIFHVLLLKQNILKKK